MITIVDDNDEVIGAKERAYAKQNCIYRIVALWLKNSEGKILLAKRTMTKDTDPGKWGPAVVGTVDEGESYDETIYREADEELGIKDHRFRLLSKQRVREPRDYFCQWYEASVDKEIVDFNLQEDEVEELKWFSAQDLRKDVKENPDSYVGAMSQILEELKV